MGVCTKIALSGWAKVDGYDWSVKWIERLCVSRLAAAASQYSHKDSLEDEDDPCGLEELESLCC